jgi:hypothetical protein
MDLCAVMHRATPVQQSPSTPCPLPLNAAFTLGWAVAAVLTPGSSNCAQVFRLSTWDETEIAKALEEVQTTVGHDVTVGSYPVCLDLRVQGRSHSMVGSSECTFSYIRTQAYSRDRVSQQGRFTRAGSGHKAGSAQFSGVQSLRWP